MVFESMTQPDISAQHSKEANQRQQLRQFCLQQRQAIPASARRQADQVLQQLLLAWHRQHQPQCLAVYWPIKGEPDLLPAYRELQQQGAMLALPRVLQPGAALEFCPWLADTQLQPDRYGIPSPLTGAATVPADALLIPCVGFNRDKFRLGYGGGFYDRTLASEPRPYALGLAYACLEVDFVAGVHDIAMDLILTERSIPLLKTGH